MNGIIGHFLSSNTTYEYELLWNSENVTNVTKVLNVRENWKWKTYLNLIEKFDSVGKMMLYGICEGRLNPWIFEWKFNRNSLLLCLFTVWLEQGAALITNCLVVHFLLQSLQYYFEPGCSILHLKLHWKVLWKTAGFRNSWSFIYIS